MCLRCVCDVPAGKIGDIDEVPPGKSEVSFRLLLSGSKRDAELTFTKFKIRVYPGVLTWIATTATVLTWIATALL